MIKYEDFKTNCRNCFGLCCVALNFTKSQGFPKDKPAGKACENLKNDFRCVIHESSEYKKLYGCIRYDCFGAGERVSQSIYKGIDWIQKPEKANEMFSVFVIVRELHEFLFYLLDGLNSDVCEKCNREAENKIKYIMNILESPSCDIKNLDMDLIWTQIKEILFDIASKNGKRYIEYGKPKLKITNKILSRPDLMGRDLRKFSLKGMDLSGSFLISANLSGANLDGTNFIGADLRDCDLRGSNLKNALYLNQRQINSAKGNNQTILPDHIERPLIWENK